MKITILFNGRTNVDYIRQGIEEYLSRLKHYIKFEIIEVPEIKNAKNLSEEQYRQNEAELMKKNFPKSDYIVLLDENGNEFSSEKFARFLEHKIQTGIKNLMFIVGGPYGFSDEIKNMASYTISLSQMTFPHQLVRLIFAEQLYRAFTIIKRKSNHHS